MKKSIISILFVLIGHLLFGQEEIFTMVEEMPVFPGCEKYTNEQERRECSNKNIFEFVKDSTEYPAKAKEMNLTGTVYARFIIDEKGEVYGVKVIKGIKDGALLDSAAVEVIRKLPKMIPGKQRGEPKKVQYVTPIRFKL